MKIAEDSLHGPVRILVKDGVRLRAAIIVPVYETPQEPSRRRDPMAGGRLSKSALMKKHG